jgi:hypothetical protein
MKKNKPISDLREKETKLLKRMALKSGSLVLDFGPPKITGKYAVTAILYEGDHYQKTIDAANVIQLFENDPEQFKIWFAQWSKTPDLETMRYLLWAAEEMGIKQDAIAKTDKMHAKNRDSRKKAEALWSDMKVREVSKNVAAKEIASVVPLAVTTIRKLLQGL